MEFYAKAHSEACQTDLLVGSKRLLADNYFCKTVNLKMFDRVLNTSDMSLVIMSYVMRLVLDKH